MTFNYNKLSRIRLMVILLATVIVLILMGDLYYSKEKELIEDEHYNILKSVAELKSDQLSQWYQDRIAEATFFSSGLTITQPISDISNGKLNNNTMLRNSLKQVMHDHRYENIFVINSEGEILFSVVENYRIDSSTMKSAKKVFETGVISINDFYYCKKHQKVHFDIVAPVFGPREEPLEPQNIIASMVFRVDPHTYLYPLIRLWPGESKTAETVIGRAEGNKVVFLNDLGNNLPNAALLFGWPIDDLNHPIVRAVHGLKGRYIGTDYAGNKVLSDLRHIPGTPWSMVVKMDTSEVYRELYIKSAVVSGAIILLVFTVVSAIVWIYNRKLKESEKNFYSLFEKAPLAYQSLDVNGDLLEVNQAWCDMMGYDRINVIGRSFGEFLPPENIPAFISAFQQFKMQGKFSADFLLIRSDGQVINVHHEGNVTYNTDGTFKKTHCILQDITERNRIFKLLKENERRFASLISHLPGFVYRCKNDKEWTVLYISENCQPITGYSSDELTVNESGYDDIIAPEFKTLVSETIRKALDSGDFFEVEYQIVHKSGIRKWMCERGKGVYDETGQLLFLEGYVEDISVRWEANQALVEAKEKAEESDRLKTAFLANMSHEIRTPMNGILGFLELLKEPELSIENKNEYLDLMNVSGQRLLSTINDIIEISKIESGKLETKLSKVDLRDMFRFYVDFFRHEAELKKINLVIGREIEGDHSCIMGDRHKLDGILTNLVKNAIKFTKSGTIELNCSTEGDQLLIWVKDTGKGIPAHRQKAIFERFVQADMNFTRDYEGSGLGLAIVKAYVDTMQGTIWVESTEGKGSTFYVKIPYIHASGKKIPCINTKEPTKQLYSNMTILVAEDDDISFTLMKRHLQIIGINVIRAVTGSECVDIARKNPGICMILMDVKMPEMDGYQATAKIREFNPELPIIAQTAYALEYDKELALSAGCTDYLSKPVSKEKLIQMIDRYSKGVVSYEIRDMRYEI